MSAHVLHSRFADGNAADALVLPGRNMAARARALRSSRSRCAQSKTQRLDGADAILQHLERGELAEPANATRQLPRGRPNEGISIEASDGDWVPGKPDTADAAPGAAADRGAAELWELCDELIVLRGAHEGLRARVARLEGVLRAVAD